MDGIAGWAANIVGKSVATNAEATRLALERCELQSAMAPCTLFVVNEVLKFNPLLLTWTPKIDYTRKVFGTNIPGTRDADFAGIYPAYMSKVNSYKTAMHLTAAGTGGYGYAEDYSTAVSNSKSHCGTYTPAGFPCIQYLNGTTIIMTQNSIQSALGRSMGMFCKSVPRRDCATHKLMGCSNASLYTTATGAVVREVCPL